MVRLLLLSLVLCGEMLAAMPAYADGGLSVSTGADYRVRSIQVRPYELSGTTVTEPQWTEQRLRVDLALSHPGTVTFHLQADLLDGVLFGDNGVARAFVLGATDDPLFAFPIDLGDEVDLRALGFDHHLGFVAFPLNTPRVECDCYGEIEEFLGFAQGAACAGGGPRCSPASIPKSWRVLRLVISAICSEETP